MLWLLLSQALANPSVALGGGLSQTTQLPMLGADVAWHARTDQVSLHGRVAPGWGFAWTYDELPSGRLRLSGLAADGPFVLRHGFGLTGIVPLEGQAMNLRLGVEVGGEFVAGADLAPIGPGSWGYNPRVLAIGEFVRDAASESAIGLRIGVGSTPTEICDPSLSLDCIRWRPGISGGIYGYVWLGKKIQLEAEIGSTTWITVGYRFGRKEDEPAP